MRLRLAHRIFTDAPLVSRDDLMTIREADVRASWVYSGGLLAGLATKKAGTPADPNGEAAE